VRYKNEAVHSPENSKRGAKQGPEPKLPGARVPFPATLGSIGGATEADLRRAGQEKQVQEAIGHFTRYLRSERECYYADGRPLGREWRDMVEGFFAEPLLDSVRVLELKGQRVSNPWFYPLAKERGIKHLPDLTHKATVTFLDVVVFNGDFSARDLFHGLVHAAQVKVMGVNEFTDLFVRGFLKARSYFLVPLKAHAFAMDAKFAANPSQRFSVEEEIRHWWCEGKY
jgi:hypothetical protein